MRLHDFKERKLLDERHALRLILVSQDEKVPVAAHNAG